MSLRCTSQNWRNRLGKGVLEALALSLVILPAGQGNAARSDYMLAWWRSDEGAGNMVSDNVGPYEGTLHGASWAQDAAPVRGGNSALAFGAGSYVEIPDAKTFGLGDWATLTAWICPSALPSGGSGDEHAWIFGKYDEEGSPILALALMSGSRIGFGVRTEETPAMSYAIATVPMEIGVWHHVAGVYHSPLLMLYVDGVLAGWTRLSGSIVQSPGPSRIGSSESGSEWHGFQGKVDEVRIYQAPLLREQILEEVSVFKVLMQHINGLAVVNYFGMNGTPIGCSTVMQAGTSYRLEDLDGDSFLARDQNDGWIIVWGRTFAGSWAVERMPPPHWQVVALKNKSTVLCQQRADGPLFFADMHSDATTRINDGVRGWTANGLDGNLILLQQEKGGSVGIWDMARNVWTPLTARIPGWAAKDLDGMLILAQKGIGGQAGYWSLDTNTWHPLPAVGRGWEYVAIEDLGYSD